MKKSLLLSSALVLGTMSSSWAGGLPEAHMDKAVIEQDTSSSAGGIIIPLLLLVIIATAVTGGGGGGGGPIVPVEVSDIRLKEDIAAVGMTPQGLPLYRWRYKGLAGQWQGVMAQDVARLHPQALVPMPFGYMAVDYARLGLTMQRVA